MSQPTVLGVGAGGKFYFGGREREGVLFLRPLISFVATILLCMYSWVYIKEDYRTILVPT
jgi:hypothetical protein